VLDRRQRRHLVRLAALTDRQQPHPAVVALNRDGCEFVALRPLLAVTANRCVRRKTGYEYPQAATSGGRELNPQILAVVVLQISLEQTPAVR
jgi:hypothetical protein